MKALRYLISIRYFVFTTIYFQYILLLLYCHFWNKIINGSMYLSILAIAIIVGAQISYFYLSLCFHHNLFPIYPTLVVLSLLE